MATLNTRIQLRNDTAARWEQINPVLYSGEFGFEKDTGLFKVGNGVTAWNSLPYANDIYDYDASQLFLSAQHKIGLRNYGKEYYKVKDNGAYELVTVDEEHPWKAGLTPRIAEEDGELVLAWFEVDPTPAAPGVSYAVVDELPEVGESNVIYLVKDETVTSGDIYKEYLYIDGTFTQIGDTSVNLDGYVKEVDSVLFDIDENDTLVSALKELVFSDETTKSYQAIGENVYYDAQLFGEEAYAILSRETEILNHVAAISATETGIALLAQIGQDALAGKYAKQVLVVVPGQEELTITAADTHSISMDRVEGLNVQHITVYYSEANGSFTISFIDHIRDITDLFEIGDALELVTPTEDEESGKIVLDIKKVDGHYIFENQGSGSDYVLPVATAAQLGGVLSNDSENGILVAEDGKMTVNTLNVDKLVGDLDLDCGGAEVED